ncbi:hypothetical protein K458DRAFT_492387 [Lentithecium fluviatile CBS 122367]|uniref:Carbohydrate-binding module family 19 domain-containing protein n=1 Tax=Lentithecium fluviatile CBS 122367 TaxID=1168545 RepID=A0A6G1IEK6_9PLEO|nr:hypothetical protein K458DRAFT_492387 [Lentithecium fluviatile CBS 122367]
MRFFITLAALASLAASAALPTVAPIDEPYPLPTVVKPTVIKPSDDPYPMPTVVHPTPVKPNLPVKPTVTATPAPPPLFCTKICAFSAESLECGKGWFAHQSGNCWSCCTKKDVEIESEEY